VSEPSPVYALAEDLDLRQGEIISDLTYYFYDSEAAQTKALTFPLSIIVSQDCDLLADFNARQNGSESQIRSVLLFEVDMFEEAKDGLEKGSQAKKKVRQNQTERYHFLEGAPKEFDTLGVGLPDLLIDFRRFFTLPPVEVYRQTKEGGGAKRRTRLEMPYREHLQTRMAFYLQRVGLPRPHGVAPLTPEIVAEAGIEPAEAAAGAKPVSPLDEASG
jgi:hypothetical protein